MTKIEFHPEAEDDLAEAKQWYRQRSRLAARAFATRIRRRGSTDSNFTNALAED